MPTYVLLTTLTAEGGHTLHAHPERMLEVNREISDFGCKVVSQYALLGSHDFITIIDAPDNATVAHLSIDLSSRRTVKITTLAAIPIEELVEKLKGPKQIGRK
jgi:uncharacterized protein with GYD domain